LGFVFLIFVQQPPLISLPSPLTTPGQVFLTGPCVDEKGEEGRDLIASMTSATAAAANSAISAAWAAINWVIMEQEWIRGLFGGKLQYDFRWVGVDGTAGTVIGQSPFT